MWVPAGCTSSQLLVVGRRFRIMTLVDDFTRECPGSSWTRRSPACVSLVNSLGLPNCATILV